MVQVIADDKRAWHAGVSSWENDTNLNGVSIGIEHVNKGFVDNNTGRVWFPFDSAQIRTSGVLSRSIVHCYGIKPWHVLGMFSIRFYWKKSNKYSLFWNI